MSHATTGNIDMFKCEWFEIWELVSQEKYESRYEKAWSLLDERALYTLDALREKYGKMTVNDWYWGGKNQWRGLRTPDSEYYSENSQHTFGRAFDVIFHSVTAEQVRQDMNDNPDDPAFKYINSIEEGVSWFHFDVRNTDRVLKFPGPIKH